MSGDATFAGTSYQARTIALVYAHILAQMKLGWLTHQNDQPIAVSGETDGPGDDARVEFEAPLLPIEIQAKHGLTGGAKLDEAIERIRSKSMAGTGAVILLVDRGSSRTVASDFAKDLDRIRSGRTDKLKSEATRVRSALGIDAKLLESVYVQAADLDRPSDPEMKSALLLLSSVLEEPTQDLAAMGLLISDANEVCARRLRRTRRNLVDMLEAAKIKCKPPKPDEKWYRLLDFCRNLLQQQHFSAALAELRKIEASVAGKSTEPLVKYRLCQQIGAALLQAERPEEALESTRRALDIDSSGIHALVVATLASIQIGDLRGAAAYAERACTSHAGDAQAWGVRALVAAARGEAAPTVPSSVASTNAYKMYLARIAADCCDWNLADDLTAEILRLGERERPLLLLRANVLVRKTCSSDEEYHLAREDAVRLASEVIENLHSESSPLYAKALVVRAQARLQMGALQDAEADLATAREIDGADPASIHLAAESRINAGDENAALGILTHPVVERTSSLLAVRSQLFASRGDRASARRDLDACLRSLSDSHDVDGARILAAEAALALDETGLAEQMLHGFTLTGTRAAVASVLLGRIAFRRNQVDVAETYFRRAAEAGSQMRGLALSVFASNLRRRGDARRAVSVFQELGLTSMPETILKMYARALMDAEDFPRAEELLRFVSRSGQLPGWAVSVAINLALRQEDSETAISLLTDLARSGAPQPNVILTLSHLLIEVGRTESAVPYLRKLGERPELEPADRMRVAHLLHRSNSNDEAMAHAFRAFRAADDDAEMHRAFVTLAFAIERPKSSPQCSGPDTYIKMEGPDGGVFERTVFAEPPYDARRGEISLSDAEALGLLGKSVGDTVVINAGQWNEKRWVIRELLPAVVRAIQDAVANYELRFPLAPFFVTGFSIGDGTSVKDFAPLISTVHAKQRRIEGLAQIQREHILPLGFMSRVLDCSIPEFMSRTDAEVASFGPLWADWKDKEGRGHSRFAARSANRVVMTRSALHTAHCVEVLDHLADFKPAAPASLVKELRQELRKAESRVERGHSFMTAGTTGLKLVEWESNHPDLIRAANEIRSQLNWLINSVEILPRPVEFLLPSQSVSEQIRTMIGDSSADAIALATHHGMPLYADDLGLRRIRLENTELHSFSTFTLLCTLAERGAISADRRDHLIVTLIGQNYVCASITPDLLHFALRNVGALGWPLVRRVFVAALSSEAVASDVATMFARTFRSVVLAPIQVVGLEMLVEIALGAMNEQWSAGLCAKLLQKAAAQEFAFLPGHLKTIERRCQEWRDIRQ